MYTIGYLIFCSIAGIVVGCFLGDCFDDEEEDDF
jgi:hypothetical protein